ncbi:Aste57867_19498 [Aphanomyces stellatus]|uniref:Aste57867_19498 protein n=1 Tax=Aphanomyces stellatus TaxID=120398 RepID=A0A485LCZ1_9STRA|nr:hypothetical protein As57867_019434 [Aphanomyces stellatus]VFT96209.1 Aste57867_19498 [Aphanomyces stellatus]
MIRPDQEPILLTTASSKSAKIKTRPSTDLPLIPTRHLNLPDDFYSNPKRVKQFCAFRQPEHILPRYGEFIVKLVLRAHAMQYLFQFQDPQPRCVFCGANETYQHILFACPFGQSVWQPFKLHLRQLLQDLPLKKGYIKVLNLLKQLSRDSWLKQFVLPDAVQD